MLMPQRNSSGGSPKCGEPRVSSSPPVTNFAETLRDLTALGLDTDSSAFTHEGCTELDLLRTTGLELEHYDVLTGIEGLKAASHGALTTSDLLPLRYDRELRATDRLL